MKGQNILVIVLLYIGKKNLVNNQHMNKLELAQQVKELRLNM